MKRPLACFFNTLTVSIFSCSAMAAVIDSGPVAIAIPNTFDGLFLDLATGTASPTSATNAGWDINPYGTGLREFFFRPTSPSTGCYRTAPLLTGCDALPLNRNIALGSPFSPGGFVGGTNFNLAGTRTVGFRFQNEATGQVNYGYLTLNALGATGLDATITRYVYENTGAAIVVGGNNTPPTITATSGLAQQRGALPRHVTIASVTDDDGDGTVRVLSSGTSSGISLSFITNTAGTISANLSATCTAGVGNFVLTATDLIGVSAATPIVVGTTANTAPTLGSYGATALNVGASTTVAPMLAPTDTGTITSITATAPGFTGTLSVDPVTGTVSVTNAGPAGVYPVTVSATDNCGASASLMFTLTVNVVNVPPTITAASGLTRQRGSPPSISTIATVTDDQGNAAVIVGGAGADNGVGLVNIVNTDGTVTARLAASCVATSASFNLSATDPSSAVTMAVLNVAVSANTPPALGSYLTSSVSATGTTTITPSAAPSDNGQIDTITASAPGFTGTLSVNASTGVVSVGNAGPPGVYTVTVTATDNCGASSIAAFSLTVILNTPPTILAATGLSRQLGSLPMNSTIATVTDDGGNGTVVVTGAVINNGVRLSAIANTSGTVTGDLRANCTASATSFLLTATDTNGATASATLNVAVSANTAAILGTYAATSINTGASTTASPSAAPSDNGVIATISANAPGFTGTLSVDTLTGLVSIGNAGPAGIYTVTVSATDNCGATSTASFALNVNSSNTAPIVMPANNVARQQGSAVLQSTIATVTDDGGSGLATMTINAGASATNNGVTVSALSNTAGVISAAVIAGCTATNAAFTLTASDTSSLASNATLNVAAITNTPPILGSYLTTSVVSSGTTNVVPNATPSDNGSINTLTATAPGFAGILSANPSTGVVTANSAGPIGQYIVTVTATDNCGASASTTFLLNVGASDLFKDGFETP
jgi:hypothetical protein